MKKSSPLIRTKLHQPFIRAELVPRPHLQEQIEHGIRGPLTLVTAPAGFGKTTLVASALDSWRRHRHTPAPQVAWLSLDKDDNQTGRFLTYLIAALQMVDNQFGIEAAQLIAEIQEISPEVVLTSLINDLDTKPAEIVLVFDDYQFITSQEIHAQLIFLLEHCPQKLHLLIASRSDPALPLARLRARSQLVELRAADLRFTSEEVDLFLNHILRLHLDEGSIEVLEKRTEGWVAGLQMAAIALQSYRSTHDQKNVREFIERFSGTNRYILDYLLEEVLAGQPPDIQFFLLCTSILERLTASLCEVMLSGVANQDWYPNPLPAGSPPFNFGNCQPILAYLEQANLFLIALDDNVASSAGASSSVGAKWYRYHHLFIDLLRTRLAQLYPGLATRLHILASAWFQSNAFFEEAIHQSLAGGDYPEAARLVEEVAENAWLNGQYTSILAWTKALPTELVSTRPWLCIWNAWAHTQLGVSQNIDQWINAAEQASKHHGDIPFRAGSEDSVKTEALRMEIAALKVFTVSFSGDYHRAIQLAESFLESPLFSSKETIQFTRCNILHLISSMYFATGDLLRAEQASQEAVELAKEMRFVLRLLHCTNKLILINTVYGRLNRSHQLIEETLEFLQQQGFGAYFAALQLDFRKLELLYEWNHMEEFQQRVEIIIQHAAMLDVPYLLVDSFNIQALHLLTIMDYSRAQTTLNKAKALANHAYIWEGLTWRTERLQVKLWLQSGELSLATRWNSQPGTTLQNHHRFPNETQDINRTRILLAKGDHRGAISILDRLSQSAEDEGRNGSLLEIRILKAVALLGLENVDQAVAEIKKALAISETEGYVRIFIDEGQPIKTLLSRVAQDASSPQAKYAQRLLAAFAEKGAATLLAASQKFHEESTSSLSNASLIEPLSQRELEILGLLAEGKTNQDIARQLIVATGTVKAHAANIYRKLDVANRTEAVSRARQLGILP